MASKKDMKNLIRELKSLNCDVFLAGGHYQIHRDGLYLATVAGTPTDHRSLLNAKALLRRLGVPLRRK